PTATRRAGRSAVTVTGLRARTRARSSRSYGFGLLLLDARARRLRQGPHPDAGEDGKSSRQRDAAGEPPAAGDRGDGQRREELDAPGDVHDHRHRRAPDPGRKQLREIRPVARPGAGAEAGHEHAREPQRRVRRQDVPEERDEKQSGGGDRTVERKGTAAAETVRDPAEGEIAEQRAGDEGE